MAAWGVLVVLLALTWNSAFAFPATDYAENVRGNQRIVSGWEAREGQFPYQLSLRMVSPAGAVFACGATVIHNEWAMTAAHCTANRVTIVIRAGVLELTRPQKIFETTEYYNHPLYIPELPFVQPNDIGVIKFNRFVEYTDLIKPIRLQSSFDKNKNYDSVVLQASGWGNVWTGGPSPSVLNWVYLLGTSNFDCWVAFGFNPIIVDSTICARHFNVTSQSTCQGDSGGPLLTIDDDGYETQVGISSFVSGAGCHAGFPAGFIRPGHYHDWLFEVTGINFDWNPKETTTAAPPTTTTKVPTTADPPANTTTEAPPTTTTEAPTNTTTGAPPTTTTEAPANTTTEAPPTTTTEAPANTTTEAPPTTTTEAPAPTTTEAPANTTTEAPATTTTEAPATTTTEAPATTTTEAPAPTTTEAPATTTTEAPATTTTEAPATTTTEAPATTTSEAPPTTTSEAPATSVKPDAES